MGSSFIHLIILSLLPSLCIGNVAARHGLLCVVFNIDIFLKHPRNRGPCNGVAMWFFLVSLSLFFSYKSSDSYTCSSHWYISTIIKRIPLINVNLSFLVSRFPCCPLPGLRVDGLWQFRFCISEKKHCWALLMGSLLSESILSCIHQLMFSWEWLSFVFLCVFVFIYVFILFLDVWHLKSSRVGVMSSTVAFWMSNVH